MKHRIIVDRNVPQRLAKLMGVTEAAVSMALNYKTDSPRSKRIRHLAVKDFEGVEVGA